MNISMFRKIKSIAWELCVSQDKFNVEGNCLRNCRMLKHIVYKLYGIELRLRPVYMCYKRRFNETTEVNACVFHIVCTENGKELIDVSIDNYKKKIDEPEYFAKEPLGFDETFKDQSPDKFKYIDGINPHEILTYDELKAQNESLRKESIKINLGYKYVYPDAITRAQDTLILMDYLIKFPEHTDALRGIMELD